MNRINSPGSTSEARPWTPLHRRAPHRSPLAGRRCWALCVLLAASPLARSADFTAGSTNLPARMSRHGEPLPVLTTVQAVRHLPLGEAHRGYAVRVTSVVTYHDTEWHLLFVQDETGGIFVNLEGQDAPVRLGQRVQIDGFTAPGDFAPVIAHPQFRVLGDDAMPEPRVVALEQLMTGHEDSQWVAIEGVVRGLSNQWNHVTITVATGNGSLQATIPGLAADALPWHWIDAEVQLRGACATLFNQRRQIYGIHLYVPTTNFVSVTRSAPADPFSIPAQPIQSLFQFTANLEPVHRVKVQGTVTLQRWQQNFFVQDESGGLFFETETPQTIERGQKVEVIGFPALGEFTPVLQYPLIRPLGAGKLPAPERRSAEQILSNEFTNKLCDAAVVRMSARFLEGYETADDYILVCQDGQYVFDAHLELAQWKRHPTHLKRSTLIQLTGVCSIQVDENRHPRAFRLLLSSADDIFVLQRPPWWGTRHSVGLALGLAAACALASGWAALLRRQVRRQTAVMRRQIQQETALEKRFSDLVENAYDIIYEHDLAGKLTAFNLAGEKILGYAPAEALRMNVADIVAPDQVELARRMTALKQRGAPATIYELEVLAKDGRRVPLEISSRPLVRDGQVVGVQGIARDITERRQAETRKAAFSALGQKLSSADTPESAARTIVEVADSLLGWDACSLDLYSSSADRMFTVLNIDVIEGQRTVAPPAYLGREPTPMARRVFENGAELILRQGPFEIPPNVIPFGDTGRPSASLLYVPIRNDTRVIGLLTIQSYTPNAYDQEDLRSLQSLADFAAGALERLRAEMALKESEQWLKALFDASRDGIGVETEERITYVNQAFARLHGYDAPEELIGQPVTLVQAPEDNERLLEFGRKRLRGEPAPSTYTFKGRKKDGTLADMEASVSTVDVAGKKHIIAVVRDIRERLELEAQLRHSQKMESVGQLAAGVAHDFNNIMTVVQGHACLLLSSMRLDPQSADSLRQISGAADRAAHLTRQLLTFSRKQMMRVQWVDLNAVVRRVSELLGRTIGESIVVQHREATALPMIPADTAMLEQLILNLAVNARDAMPQGGTLVFSTSLSEINESHLRQHPESRPGSFVCLTVSDTGYGMDAATLSRIFEPFFTTKDIGKGTGLGLSTVYGIVKQHQGWIEVFSEVGRGTSFKIFFPVKLGPADDSLKNPPSDFPREAFLAASGVTNARFS